MVACGRVKDAMRNTPRWRFSAYGAYEARKPGDLGSGRSHGNAQANTQAGGHFLRQHPIRGQLKMPCITNVIHGINYFVFFTCLLDRGQFTLIEKKLIFINPEFTLYGNQPDLPIVLRSQLNEYLKSIESQADPLQNYPHQVAAYLEKIKLAQNPYEKTPKYSYEMLDKGILCKSCGENHLREGHRSLLCSSCGLSETKSSAIERMIEEYRLLFPDRKFTPTILKEWCGNVVSLDLCGRVLRKYLRSN